VRLPDGERAIIDPEKLRDYVLSRVHPVGRFKAAFFASLGYEIDNWQDLDRALRAAPVKPKPSPKSAPPTGRSIAFGVCWRGLRGARPKLSQSGSSSTTRRPRGS
jgi:hypothetical protein